MGCTSTKAKKNQQNIDVMSCDVLSEDNSNQHKDNQYQFNTSKLQHIKQQHNLQYYHNNKLVVPIHQYVRVSGEGYKFYQYSPHNIQTEGWSYDHTAFFAPSQDFQEAIAVYQFSQLDNQGETSAWKFSYSTIKDLYPDTQILSQDAFRGFAIQYSGTIPVYRYTYKYAENVESELLNFESPSLESQGWVRGDVAFYAFKNINTSVPVYQYSLKMKDNTQYYFYSTDKSLATDDNNWILDKIAFQVPSEDFSETVSVFLFSSGKSFAQGGVQFNYTTNPTSLNEQWKLDSEIFRSFDKQVQGTQPVYLFQADVQDDRPFRRVYLSTQQQPLPGYARGEILFYAFTNIQNVPIHQYFTKGDDGSLYYFYSANPNETQGWTYDKIAFYVPASQHQGTVPVNQYYLDRPNKNWGYNFNYSVDKAEVGWKLEKEAFYSLPEYVEGAVPVYRFSAPNAKGNKSYQLVMNQGQIEGWMNEGIAFWAFQA